MAVDYTVKKETGFVALGVLIMSALMEAVYLIAGQWSYYILIGNAISGATAVLNFYLMGVMLQKSLGDDAETAKKRIKLSQNLRSVMVLVIICAAASLAYNGVVPDNCSVGYVLSLLIPLLFNRLIVSARTLAIANADKNKPS